jgi:hypothetical protein
MNATHTKMLGCLSATVATVILAGCQALDTTPRPDTQSQYRPVEYRRLVSGIFVSELANKYIQVDCRFSGESAGTLPGGLSPDEYISFYAMAPAGESVTTEGLKVVAPKNMIDLVFSLKYGDSIRIKGRAREVEKRSAVGKVWSDLVVEAKLIEKAQ